MVEALVAALINIFEPTNAVLLLLGVVTGLILGFIPGLSGVTGFALLLPFVFGFEPKQAMILLVSMGTVGATSDTLPAVLLGVPGTISAQATIMDGFPMAKKGEAGRALGAAYMSSMLGGIFGAIVLLLALPILKPLVLAMGSPELLMMALLGLSMLGVLSGREPIIGLTLGTLGVIISMVGMDPQTGFYRWTYGVPYLSDGVPLIPAILGLYALPDLVQMLALRSTIATVGEPTRIGSDIKEGIKDAFRHWFLVLRCSLLGTLVGALPGLGADAASWIAYGHVRQSVRDRERIGTGDVRGVLGPESANNSIYGGSLIPTIAFGVPGSLIALLLLGAFMMLGIVPGPDMLTTRLDVTTTIIATLALANVVAAAICLLVGRYAARLCFIRLQILAPIILVAIFIAALQASGQIQDLLTFFAFSLVGWALNRCGWPRPPLTLGLILGPIVGQYFFISEKAYGLNWMTRPGVVVVALIIVSAIWYSARSSTLGRATAGRQDAPREEAAR